MRVLLVSPIDPDVPKDLKYLMGGENTYTRTMLLNPPSGIDYVHHIEALESGEIEYGSLHKFLSYLVKFRILPLSAGTVDIKVLGDFDLVHCHAYTLRISGNKALTLPVVMGDSIPTYWSLFKYFNQSAYRVELNYSVRRVLHRMLNIYDQDLSLGNFFKLIVMSEFSRQEHIRLGADSEKTSVVYPGLADRGVRKEKKGVLRILFAGVWFKRKGGKILIEAFVKLRSKFGSKVELRILGPIPKNIADKGLPDGITQKDYVPYTKLVEDVYPNTDLLVHVPPDSEGYGLVVQEAMSFGIPAIVTKVGALPEMVVNNESGLVIKAGNVRALERALEKVVTSEKNRLEMGRKARIRYKKYFSLEKMQEQLKKIYSQAILSRKTGGC